MTTILIKKKDTAGAPAAGDLTNAAGGAEIAVNTATKRIYSKDSGGTIIEMGTFPSSMAVQGALSATGNVTLGDAAADNITVNGTVTSNLIFTDNTYDIGASGATRPRNLYLAGDATVGGNIVLTGSLDLTNLEVTNIKAKDGTASITLADSTGVASFTANPVLSGGTANGVAYLNGSKVLTTGSSLTFDGTSFTVGSKTSLRSDGPFLTGANLTSGANSLAIGGEAGSSLIGFFVNNSEGMRLTTTGMYLDTSTGGGRITFSPGATRNQILSTTTGFGAYNILRNQASSYEWLNASSTQMMTLDASGNLGVGATGPLAKINAYNGTSRTLIYAQSDLNFSGAYLGTATSTNRGGSLELVSHSDGVNSQAWRTAVSLDLFGAQDLVWSNAPNSTTYAGLTYTNRMRLDTAGNLLLGTTTAGGRLTVATTTAVDAALTVKAELANYASIINIEAQNDNGAIYNYIASNTTGVTQHWKISGGAAANTMAFSTGGTERARFTSVGNYYAGATSGLGAGTFNGLYRQTGSYVAGGQVTELLGYWMSNANDNNGQGGVGIQYYRVPRGGGVQTGTEIRFYTGYSYTPSTTAERMRIDQDGNCTLYSGYFYLNDSSKFVRGGASGQLILGADSGGLYQQAGSNYYLVTTAGGSTSDATLKTNVQQLSGALGKVCAIRGVNFEFIEDPMCTADKGTQLGVIAQEVEAQYPEIVLADDKGKKTVRYDRLVAPLIEAIKELKAEFDAYKASHP
jgi:trimeric autotransporter adhesin